MSTPSVERWPRLIAEHRERQAALASAEAPRAMAPETRWMLWVLAVVSGAAATVMTTGGIREIDLSPTTGLADSVGLAWGAIYAGILLVLTGIADGISVGLGRSLPSGRRAIAYGLASALTILVLIVLALLQISADRLTYV